MVKKALTGTDASAEAMRQINPDVVAAYPITPQTHIMEKFAQFVADGKVDTELIRVESEHSAMSACVGSAAAGARTMTATSSAGFALMVEIVYIAAGMRLPIVMSLVNRALSGPINIHNDHSDSMLGRDSGWLQIFSETGQEAYENTIMAVKIAEHNDVRLPVLVCQDGFITSHNLEAVETLPDDTVKNFIGEYVPGDHLLDIDHPITVGPLDLFNYYFEHKRAQLEAYEKAKVVMKQVFGEFSKITGKKYDFTESYRLDDAELVIVAMSSACGTIKDVVDELREQGVKAGLLKLIVFRPFFPEEVIPKLAKAKAVAVFDKAAVFGGYGNVLWNEIRSGFYEYKEKPHMINYLYGLGGRDLYPDMVKQVFKELAEIRDTGNLGYLVRCLGVRE